MYLQTLSFEGWLHTLRLVLRLSAGQILLYEILWP